MKKMFLPSSSRASAWFTWRIMPRCGLKDFATWQDTEQNDFGRRLARADLLDYGSDAGKNFCLGVFPVIEIVGADHDDGDLGVYAVELPPFNPPEHILCTIAADAKVDGCTTAVIFRPDILAVAFPSLGDGVADEFDAVISGCLLGTSQHQLGTLFATIERGRRDNCGVGGHFGRFIGRGDRSLGDHRANTRKRRSRSD